MIPSFFTQAISSALIPVISKSYVNKHINYVKDKIKQAELISLSIGLLVTILIMINPSFILKFVYNTNHGSDYLKMIAPFFLLYYVQVPLTAALQAMNKAKEAMYSTIIGITIKLGLILFLSTLKIGLYGLIIATIVNVFIVTIYNFIKVRKTLS
jgi:stage V sporulation protein B